MCGNTQCKRQSLVRRIGEGDSSLHHTHTGKGMVGVGSQLWDTIPLTVFHRNLWLMHEEERDNIHWKTGKQMKDHYETVVAINNPILRSLS